MVIQKRPWQNIEDFKHDESVVIEELGDHPLSSILGAYQGTATSQWRGDFSWEVTLSEDLEDDHKVWLINPCPYFASYGYTARIYGIVNDAKTEIVFPSRQTHVSQYSTVIVGFNSVNPLEATAEADIIATIGEDGTITFTNGWGTFYTGDGFDVVLDFDREYYEIYNGGATFKR